MGSTSSLTTSMQSATDQRWSEVVPPDSSLTFAAVYDKEGLVLFCGGDVLPSTSAKPHSVDSPTDVLDCQGQLLSIEDYATAPSADNTAIRAFFCDNPPYNLGHTSPAFERFRQRESSILDGVDLYSRDLQNPKAPRQWSVFSKLDKGPNFNAKTAFSHIPVPKNAQTQRNFRDDSMYWDDTLDRVPNPGNGFLQVDQNLGSRFSSTTTSTSDYVEVDKDHDSLYSSWSAIEPQYQYGSSPNCPRSTRRLRKRRPDHLTASPAEALSRHVISQTAKASPQSEIATSSDKLSQSLRRFAGRLGKLKTSQPDERWVCVDVKHKISQHLVQGGP